MRNALDQLAIKHGTDKGTQSPGELCAKGYTRAYFDCLYHLRDKPIILLEIGIDRGASLKMWEEFFPEGRIYGIDIKQRCLEYQTDRTTVYIGDQCDREFLQQVVRDIGEPLDFVIDDGGHKMVQHQTTLEELFPAVRPGGKYAIEDLLTAYRQEFGGGYKRATSTIEYLKDLVDEINEAKKPSRSWWQLGRHEHENDADSRHAWRETVESITFTHWLAILTKADGLEQRV